MLETTRIKLGMRCPLYKRCSDAHPSEKCLNDTLELPPDTKHYQSTLDCYNAHNSNSKSNYYEDY